MAEVAVRRRPGGRSARVKAAVIEATLDELTENGYAAVTIARVATRAGVHRSAVYRRWPSPATLLAAALLDASAGSIPPDTGRLATDLRGLAVTGPRPAAGSDGMARAIAVTRALDAAGDLAEVAEVRSQLWERRIALVSEALDRAERRGEIQPGLDPELVVDVLFGAFHTRVIARSKPFTDEFAADLLNLLRVTAAAGDKPPER